MFLDRSPAAQPRLQPLQSLHQRTHDLAGYNLQIMHWQHLTALSPLVQLRHLHVPSPITCAAAQAAQAWFDLSHQVMPAAVTKPTYSTQQ